MDSDTQLTCLEFLTVTKKESSLSSLFRQFVKNRENIDELKNLKSLQKWEEQFNEFINS